MATVDKKTGKVTVAKGDSPAKIARDLGISVAQVNQAISANKTLAARQKAGSTVLFRGTTFTVPSLKPSAGAGDTGTGTGTGTTTEVTPDWVLEFQRSQQAQIESEKVSARAVAKTLAAALGLKESIVDKIADLQINQGYTAQSVQVAMRDLPEFKERFAGMDKYNKNFAADIAAGRKAQVVDPFTYLELEKDYQEVLTRYGLGDMANTNTYAELIGNDVSVQEATDRVSNVFDKINNADQLLRTQLQTYFPTLGTTDFAKALLTGKNPDDMAKQLERKYKRAEISSEMTRFNIQPSQTIATDLETLGVTREEARIGFGKVAESLQPLSKLAQIYEGTTAGIEEELTSEQFRGLQSQRRKKLTEQEKATFGGSAGTSTVSLGTAKTGSF
jgi:hypothetical protein